MQVEQRRRSRADRSGEEKKYIYSETRTALGLQKKKNNRRPMAETLKILSVVFYERRTRVLPVVNNANVIRGVEYFQTQR